MEDYTRRSVAIYTFQEHMTHFFDVNSLTLNTLKLVHQVEGFAVSYSSDEIGQVDVRASEWLGGYVDRARFGMGSAAKEGSFQSGTGTRAEAGVIIWQKFTIGSFFLLENCG